MTHAQLAASLGITRQRASQLAKRGMPTTSATAAQAWRRSHTKAAGRKGISQPKLDTVAGQVAALEKANPASVDACKTYLDDANSLRRFAFDAANKLLHDDGESDEVRKWLQLVSQLDRARPALVDRLQQLQQRAGELLDADDVTAAVSAHMAKLRAMVDSWPASLAAKCNPSDPELAQLQLEAARDQLFRAMANKSVPGA